MNNSLIRVLCVALAANMAALPVFARSARVSTALEQTKEAREDIRAEIRISILQAQTQLRDLKRDLNQLKSEQKTGAPIYKGIFVSTAAALGALYYVSVKASPAARETLKNSAFFLSYITTLASVASATDIVLTAKEIKDLKAQISAVELELFVLDLELKSL